MLADTAGGKRDIRWARPRPQPVGDFPARYGTSGIEDAFDRALTLRIAAATPARNSRDYRVRSSRARSGSRSRRRHDDRAGGTTGSFTLSGGHCARPPASCSIPHRRGAGARERSELRSERFRPSFPRCVPIRFSPLLDRALDGLYPPGSTFKIFTASAALDGHGDDGLAFRRSGIFTRSATSRCTTTKRGDRLRGS